MYLDCVMRKPRMIAPFLLQSFCALRPSMRIFKSLLCYQTAVLDLSNFAPFSEVLVNNAQRLFGQ